MSETIIREWYFLIYSIATGIGMAFVYDNLRLLRRLILHKRFMVDMEDILYWTACFFASFYLLYYGNNGVVRFFAVLGAGLGMYLYTRTLGRVYVKGCYNIVLTIMKPFVYISRKTVYTGTRICRYIWKKLLTGVIKPFKIILYKKKSTSGNADNTS